MDSPHGLVNHAQLAWSRLAWVDVERQDVDGTFHGKPGRPAAYRRVVELIVGDPRPGPGISRVNDRGDVRIIRGGVATVRRGLVADLIHGATVAAAHIGPHDAGYLGIAHGLLTRAVVVRAQPYHPVQTGGPLATIVVGVRTTI